VRATKVGAGDHNEAHLARRILPRQRARGMNTITNATLCCLLLLLLLLLLRVSAMIYPQLHVVRISVAGHGDFLVGKVNADGRDVG
jgi:hypothetical protein